jgi:hypothetical protein
VRSDHRHDDSDQHHKSAEQPYDQTESDLYEGVLHRIEPVLHRIDFVVHSIEALFQFVEIPVALFVAGVLDLGTGEAGVHLLVQRVDLSSVQVTVSMEPT